MVLSFIKVYNMQVNLIQRITCILWIDSLQKEMQNIGLGLEILENDASLPVG